MEHHNDPIHKGGTSPSTAFGVPLLVFILGAIVVGQAGLAAFYFLGIPAASGVAVVGMALYAWARRVSKFDDQRLLQLLLRARMRGPQRASREEFGAISFSPFSKKD